jgi:hypothetical protein
MKKNRGGKSKSNDLLPEYRFDYAKAKPNRFAARYRGDTRLVMLDPDVAEVFTTAKSVNAALRALLKAVPRGSVKK